MFRIFYNLLLHLLLPFILFRFWWRGRKQPAYAQRLKERLGSSKPPKQQGGVLFHCVSVGETIAAIQLIQRVQAEFPTLPITITSTTPTGSEQVLKTFGDSVHHCYMPLDFNWALEKLFSQIRPQKLVIMETELWPNLIYKAREYCCDIIIANARLSERSAKGYQKISGAMRDLFTTIDHLSVVHCDDAKRFNQLGAAKHKIEVTGNIKFDINIDQAIQEKVTALKNEWPKDCVTWIAGSTHEGEESMILESYAKLKQTFPQLKLILAPRHPDRCQSVEKIIQSHGLSYQTRSSVQPMSADHDLFLLDTLGELKVFYGISDIAFIGGSLIERGGHNPLEAAVYGLPILSGQHVFNFSYVYDMMEKQQAVALVENTDVLSETIAKWLNSPETRSDIGEKALKVVKENHGSSEKLFRRITQGYQS